MRALLIVFGAVALLIGVAASPASAGKGTDFDQFIKRIGKFAVDDFFGQKPRGLCVCLDGGPYHSGVGALVYGVHPGNSGVSVWCYVRGFDPAGVHDVVQGCDTFEVLSK